MMNYDEILVKNKFLLFKISFNVVEKQNNRKNFIR